MTLYKYWLCESQSFLFSPGPGLSTETTCVLVVFAAGLKEQTLPPSAQSLGAECCLLLRFGVSDPTYLQL